MVAIDWAQVILGVAGSGLILFILNTALADYNQPSLVISTNNTSVHIATHPTPPFNETRFTTILENIGMTKATHVRLTMHYPTGNVTNYRIIFSSENTSFVNNTEPDTLILNVPRLSPYGTIFLYTAVRDLKGSTFDSRNTVAYNKGYSTYDKLYFITVSYDQGGSPPVKSVLAFTNYKDLQRIAPFSAVVMTIGSIALVFIVAIMIYKTTRWKRAIKIPTVVIFAVVGSVLILWIAHYYYPSLLIG